MRTEPLVEAEPSVPPTADKGNLTCWSRHSQLLCGLLIVYAILISLFLAALTIIYIQNAGNDTGNDTKNICLSSGCVFAANEVLRSMNPEVHPCDNFYEFVCGNFIKETIIPDDKAEVEVFSKMEDKLSEQLRIIIEEPVQKKEAKPFRMAKQLYKSCMNETRIEEIGLGQMMKIIKRMGGWPVLEGASWNSTRFTWSGTTYKLKDAGFSIDYLMQFSISPDDQNSTKRVIVLDQGSLSLSRASLEKGSQATELYSYMVDIAVMFGADREQARKEFKESLQFEVDLAQFTLKPEERRNVTKLYNPMTIPKLQEKFPSIPWYDYFSTILPKSVSVQPNETVIVRVPSYVKGLETLLLKTPQRVQANYLLWRVVKSMVSFLTDDLRKRKMQYVTAMTGSTEEEPRWKECVEFSTESFVLSMGSLYVKRFFNQEAKKNVLEMVDNIREEMYKILQSVDWMDEETRKHALLKAKSMASYIAYPEEILDITKLEDFYRKLEISDGNYLQAGLNLTKFEREYEFSRLREPVNKTNWIQHAVPAMVNAFYNPEENSILFPAGVLQGAAYSYNRPNYMNYGAIGIIIGHEITHGFDDQGRLYDQDGNLVNWWAAKTKETYLKKAKCIIDQYGNYTSEQVGLKLNGVNTQGENIADNGGTKQAYRAYNRWVQTHGEEERLPGLQDYTPQQMFWVSTANMLCSKYRSEALTQLILQDEHSPAEFRIRGSLSNRPEFARDFKCPLGSNMNPIKKCQVW